MKPRSTHPRPFTARISPWIAVAATLACSGGDRPSGPANAELQPGVAEVEAGMFDLGCAETQGDRCARCRAEADALVDECFDVATDLAISSGYVAVDTCERVSSSQHCDSYCSKPADECRRHGHTFVPTTPSDPAILNSCQAARDRDASCSETGVGPACELYAQVENPAAAAAYDCIANTPCGESPEHCYSDLIASDAGTRLKARCPEEPVSE